MADERADFLVMGAGMAGASAAAELAADGRTILIEREAQPGLHATGRSAALFSAIYGNAAVRALSRASRAFLSAPPDAFTERRLMTPRRCLFSARNEDIGRLDELEDEGAGAAKRLTGEEGRAIAPILRAEACVAAMLESGSCDIDVDALHQGWLRRLRARGGRLVCEAGASTIERSGRDWRVATANGTFSAPVLVNAAGAWADEVAAVAGVAPLGLTPRRRTAILIDAPAAEGFAAWPCVIDAAETYYFKPDSGRLLISPADETASAPCDAQPEEIDIAIAVDRFESATTERVQRVRHRWAGLRTFAHDRTPVAGFDAKVPGFFWLAGQGGYGIQTAPAMAMLAAALAAARPVPAFLADAGVEPAALSPARFAA